MQPQWFAMITTRLKEWSSSSTYFFCKKSSLECNISDISCNSNILASSTILARKLDSFECNLFSNNSFLTSSPILARNSDFYESNISSEGIMKSKKALFYPNNRSSVLNETILSNHSNYMKIYVTMFYLIIYVLMIKINMMKPLLKRLLLSMIQI